MKKRKNQTTSVNCRITLKVTKSIKKHRIKNKIISKARTTLTKEKLASLRIRNIINKSINEQRMCSPDPQKVGGGLGVPVNKNKHFFLQSENQKT